MEELRVGVIGIGLQGMGHVNSYLALPNAELVAVADVDEERVKKLARERGIPRWYTDYHQMLEEADIQAVSIATPDHLHFEPTMAAIQVDKHILLEKPMALTVHEAEQMAEAAERADLKLIVNFSHRFQLPTARVKEALDRGELGYPVYAYARLNNTLFVPTRMLSWSSRTALPHWIMTHEVDRVRWFFGSEAKRVYAVSSSGVLKGMGIDVADLYHATVELENGAIATFESAWILPETMPSVADCKVHFIFSKAWVDLDHSEPVVKMATQDKYAQPGIMAGYLHGEPVGTVYEAVKHFVKCVLEDRPTVVTARDGVAVTKIICAIVESAEKGEVVEL
jgi:predicted dehydrogenase